MKKLALIMLAVVSMALVSCGGGGGNEQGDKKNSKKYEPATPAFTYDQTDFYNVPLKGCFEVKNVGIRENSLYELGVSVTLEALQDVSSNYIYGYIVVYDENMAQIGEPEKNTYDFPVSAEGLPTNAEKGDVFTINGKIYLSLGTTAQKALEEIKYVQIKELKALKNNE